ncbi:MAG: L-glutamate gamma-semialdehyde dehydrogenase [Acidobacteria bacterium]|nr:L-glutamate gamma-semialdehyde dehydrogenase [Acidobacteriota bacterium]
MIHYVTGRSGDFVSNIALYSDPFFPHNCLLTRHLKVEAHARLGRSFRNEGFHAKRERAGRQTRRAVTVKLKPFKNEPLIDFSKGRETAKMQQALDLVRSRMSKEHPILIGDQKIQTEEKLRSYNPAHRAQIVGIFQKGTVDHVNRAVDAAQQAFKGWSALPAEKRIQCVIKAASLMRRRKLELMAWIVLEVGKSWAEADADVAEAIDFAEYYSREMLRLDAPQPLVKISSERNQLRYQPLGVGAVIPPWNFPLAIPAGMTFAAIVAGNTVVLKPSSDSPATAFQLMNILRNAGLPPGVVNFVTGNGDTVGNALVAHPKVRFTAFTGSKTVGLRINQLAAAPQPGQIWIKRVIAEMGGKDSIIVDADADLEQAVEGVAVSAFGFQGQKCSACSRAILVEKIYDKFLVRLVERTRKLRMGAPDEPGVNFGPVINDRALRTICSYIDKGRSEGRLLLGGGVHQPQGFFIEPTIIADVAPTATVAQEEIFGPVLVVIKAKDFDDALRIANNTEYGLTGAVYTRSRKKIKQAMGQFHVGNLYINRKCTGALVGVHPFGGFNMSGTDSKAGGRDYLLLFLQAKVMSEKVK